MADGAPIVILGSGVTGVYASLCLAPLPVILISPSFSRHSGSSHYAQGGIAAAVGQGDSVAQHLANTIAAGAGHVNEPVARQIISAAPECIRRLHALGVPFDLDSAGDFALAKEAAHDCPRVLHLAGDQSGAILMQHLMTLLRAAPHVVLREGASAISLAEHNGRVTGVWLLNHHSQQLEWFPAQHVVLATGGIGGLFRITTNPQAVAGQGIGMAARAGAMLQDCEFVQFHPTALLSDDDPMTLVTEALRGAGATLINAHGQRLTLEGGGSLELAPRDVVARAIHQQRVDGGEVYLDARTALGSRFESAYPQVFAACMRAGINPATTPIPVAPAAHYSIGGVASDAAGQTSLAGLYAIGEAASNGIHGANRLASNSLLEGLVMAELLAEHLKSSSPLLTSSGAAAPIAPTFKPSASASDWLAMRELATRHLGMVREAQGLQHAIATLQEMLHQHAHDLPFVNSATALLATATAALARTQSLGCHYRSDSD